MHLLQPSTNIQLSRKSPDHFLKHALRVVRKGYGFPSIFNADAVVQEQLRQGKTLEDARAGGCSGCVEVGAFGKEAYILTGYFNMPKMLELALHNGVDPLTGQQLGPRTGERNRSRPSRSLRRLPRAQFKHFLEIKLRGQPTDRAMYATQMPAPFLSVLIDDCIARGRDYNAGGARYNNTYIQFVGLGSLTDSLSAVRESASMVWRGKSTAHRTAPLPDWFPSGRRLQRPRAAPPAAAPQNAQVRQRRRLRRRPTVRIFNTCIEELDGRPDTKGGTYRVEMLPTTCHVYFGSVTGAIPDGRPARRPVSEGISPVQGADRHGPTAVIKSAAKMDHLKAGGTLFNIKFSPTWSPTDDGVDKWAHLVRSYFKLDGHHIQFNVVRADTLRGAGSIPSTAT
jgi:trans-4-hydroxy-L-proline dehydratase